MSRYTLSVIFPSVIALAVMGLLVVLRGFQVLYLPYLMSCHCSGFAYLSGVLDCFGEIHLMHVLHTVDLSFLPLD